MKRKASFNCLVLAFVSFLFFITPTLAQAQEKCGTVRYQKYLEKIDKSRSSKGTFENWINQKLQAKSNTPTRQRQQAEDVVYVIPVVVHVIHNGESLGTGTNIPDAQILNQLETLNKDFRRLNSEVNNLPAEFKALAADTKIEFVLAKQDPKGAPTTGIVRIKGPQTTYSDNDDITIKSLNHWDPELYLNIYTAPLSNNTLGYAQFPETDMLKGLSDDDVGRRSAETDGVVIHYQYFGTGYNAVSFSTGRTTTHEVGHYLGLRHIWGDGGCNDDDYVTDTPPADKSNDKCPTAGQEPVSCGAKSMYQNYMDYTPDRCMALFTIGQKDRMRIVLENSPRRKTLLTSRGKTEAVVVPDDAGIMTASSIIIDPCVKSYSPKLVLKNYGNNNVSSIDIEVKINGQLHKTESFAVNLAVGAEVTKELSHLNLTTPGDNKIEISVVRTNGVTDTKTVNNDVVLKYTIPFKVNLPHVENFFTGLKTFYVNNADYNISWEPINAPTSANPNNIAAGINYYHYSSNIGAKDILISPIYNLSNVSAAKLSFRVAHATYAGSSADGLSVYVSTDCKESLETAQLIYQKAGPELATSPATDQPFIPVGNEDWKTEVLDLSSFIGNEKVQILFVATNDYGNNLFLDDVQVFVEPTAQLDAAIEELTSLPYVLCATEVDLNVMIKNLGQESIQSLGIAIEKENGARQLFTKANLNIQPGATETVLFDELVTLLDAKNTIKLRIYAVNNEFDDNETNNRVTKQILINNSKDIIPLRQQFYNQLTSDTSWVTISSNPTLPGWEVIPAKGNGISNKAAYSNFYQNQEIGLENWLVSPLLDFSKVKEAGLAFRYAYATIDNSTDRLRVLLSTDCGKSYSHVLFDKKGQELAKTKTSTTRWTPNVQSDWKTVFIDLQDFVNLPSVRIAFIATNQGGNDLYLDDIEFYTTNSSMIVNQPEKNEFIAYPNPTSDEVNIIFNIEKREDVRIQIYDMKGAIIVDQVFPHTLNQIYYFSLAKILSGMYFIKVTSPSIQKVEKLRVLK